MKHIMPGYKKMLIKQAKSQDKTFFKQFFFLMPTRLCNKKVLLQPCVGKTIDCLC